MIHDRKYTRDHVWMDEAGCVGLSAYLLASAGRVVKLHLPELGATLATATCFGALEVDKGVLDLFAPCAGPVLERNERALTDPASIGPDTWLIRTDGESAARMSELEYETYAGTTPITPR